jgi:hypothetical protein
MKKLEESHLSKNEILIIDYLTYQCWKYNIYECGMSFENARRLFINAIAYERIENERK